MEPPVKRQKLSTPPTEQPTPSGSQPSAMEALKSRAYNLREVHQIEVIPECIISAYANERHGKTSYSSATYVDVSDKYLPTTQEKVDGKHIPFLEGVFDKFMLFNLEYRIELSPSEAFRRIANASRCAEEYHQNQMTNWLQSPDLMRYKQFLETTLQVYEHQPPPESPVLITASSYNPGVRYLAGYATSSGGHRHQQDVHRCTQLENPIRPDQPLHCMLVADGHSGEDCAKEAGRIWPEEFQKRMIEFAGAKDIPFAFYNAGKTATVDTNHLIKQAGKGHCGSTLCSTVICGDTIYGINVGDSEAIVVDNSKTVVQLAKPVTAKDSDKQWSIMKRGGIVSPPSNTPGGTPRLGRTLMPGGGLGDQYLIGLSARPKVSSLLMVPGRKYAIAVYTDGVADFATTEHLGRLIHYLAFVLCLPPEAIAQKSLACVLAAAGKLADSIPVRRFADNMTLCITLAESPPAPA